MTTSTVLSDAREILQAFNINTLLTVIQSRETLIVFAGGGMIATSGAIWQYKDNGDTTQVTVFGQDISANLIVDLAIQFNESREKVGA